MATSTSGFAATAGLRRTRHALARWTARLLLTGLTFGGLSGAAHATVMITVDLSTERMHVVSGATGAEFDWPVSSARPGFFTPRGEFRPLRLEAMHFSKKYDMAPMPYSIFFDGGYAIHGTEEVADLGRPASHGCIRLDPANAGRLYRLVEAEGALITIIDGKPTDDERKAPRPVAPAEEMSASL